LKHMNVSWLGKAGSPVHAFISLVVGKSTLTGISGRARWLALGRGAMRLDATSPTADSQEHRLMIMFGHHSSWRTRHSTDAGESYSFSVTLWWIDRANVVARLSHQTVTVNARSPSPTGSRMNPSRTPNASACNGSGQEAAHLTTLSSPPIEDLVIRRSLPVVQELREVVRRD
jgi:hypothetical protein